MKDQADLDFSDVRPVPPLLGSGFCLALHARLTPPATVTTTATTTARSTSEWRSFVASTSGDTSVFGAQGRALGVFWSVRQTVHLRSSKTPLHLYAHRLA